MGIIEKMRLDGKAIYVTGAASGIGKAAATAFAEAGADVAIVDINIEGAEKVAKEIAEATGSKTIAIQCDVTKQDQVEAMVAKVVDTYGKLDACYNNAGIALNVEAENMTYEPVSYTHLVCFSMAVLNNFIASSKFPRRYCNNP